MISGASEEELELATVIADKLLLQKENKKLKEKYENAVADYENVMFEKNKLKKQIEKVLNDYCRLDAYNKTQQKEFISYLEEKEKQFDIVGDPINSGACCGILQKYKEIIGENDV